MVRSGGRGSSYWHARHYRSAPRAVAPALRGPKLSCCPIVCAPITLPRIETSTPYRIGQSCCIKCKTLDWRVLGMKHSVLRELWRFIDPPFISARSEGLDVVVMQAFQPHGVQLGTLIHHFRAYRAHFRIKSLQPFSPCGSSTGRSSLCFRLGFDTPVMASGAASQI